MAVEDVYYLGECQPLSERILELIERYKDTDIRETDIRLVDQINPDALDNLFQEDAEGETVVQFSTSDVRVTIRGSNELGIRVTPRNNPSVN